MIRTSESDHQAVPTLEIRPVRSRHEAADFIKAAVTAQQHHAQWVRPLDLELRLFFDPRFSPFAKRNAIERFVAYHNSLPVGRIAAIHNVEHLERHGDTTGHFGFIEAVDDASVFAALTYAAEQWLAARGLTRIRGPFSGSINHEAGLLVAGFDQPHVVKTNYAPAYYGKHLVRLGYVKAMDLKAFNGYIDTDAKSFKRVHDMALRRPIAGLSFRRLTYRNWKSSFLELLDLYNAAWADNWQAVPLSREEATSIAESMLPFVKPGLVEIAEYRGEPVAMIALIPDANEVIARLNGQLLPFGWLRLLYGLHVAGTSRARVPLAGIAPRWRGTAVGGSAITQLAAHVLERARAAGMTTFEISWVLETNLAAAATIGILDVEPYRVFRIFEKLLRTVSDPIVSNQGTVFLS